MFSLAFCILKKTDFKKLLCSFEKKEKSISAKNSSKTFNKSNEIILSNN